MDFDAQAQAQASGVFDLGVEQNTVALTMQRLRRQAVQITRPKVNFMLLAKMKMMGSSMKKKVRGFTENIYHPLTCNLLYLLLSLTY